MFNRNAKYALLVTSAYATIVFSTSVQAQVASAVPTPAPRPQADRAVDTTADIVVVGSRIEGARINEALPVTVIGAEDIAATGAISGDDLFRSIPQFGDVLFNDAGTAANLNGARGDVASINLRNLGTGNTLVLLNGRRVVPHPGTQTENFVPVQTANTNALPVTGIRRVELLRDGAAAIYGTDAVAGVVNTVLETKFDGVRADAQFGLSEGNIAEFTTNLKAGTKLGPNTQVMFFGGYTSRDGLRAIDRDFSANSDHRSKLVGTPFEGSTAFDNRSTLNPWGAFRVVGSTAIVRQNGVALTSAGQFNIQPADYPNDNCSSTTFGPDVCIRSGGNTTAATRELRYDVNQNRTMRNQVERINLFTTLQHDFGDVEAFTELGYYSAIANGTREQAAPVGSAPITVPASNFYNPFGPITLNGMANPNRLPGLTNVPAEGRALTLTNYRPVDAGPRFFRVKDTSYRLLAGLRGRELGFDWETAALYSRARTSDVTNNSVSNTLFQAALAKSTPDAYNPFNGGSTPNYSSFDATPSDMATIQSMQVPVERIAATSLAMVDFKASRGNLFTLPGGPVGLALGVEYRRETYSDDRDERIDGTITYTNSVTGQFSASDVLGASPSPDVEASRSIVSAYAELAIPLISEDMNVPLIRNLDVQLAARDEYYSDFGNVLKPKVAVGWRMFDWLLFRGSASQSFRAPNLPQFYSEGTQVNNGRIDWAFCRLNNVACTSLTTTAIRSGNQNLGPETADTYSLGAVFESTFLPREYGRLTVTADYWKINQKNVIGIETDNIQILDDFLKRLNGSTNPNVVRLPAEELESFGRIDFIRDDYMNITPRTVEGIDVEVMYTSPRTKFGGLSVRLNVARLLSFDQSPTDVAAQVIAANNDGLFGPNIVVTAAGNQIGINGRPEWRGTGSITWNLGQFRANAFVNYVGSVTDTGPIPVNGEQFRVESNTTVNFFAEYTFKPKRRGDEISLRFGVRNAFNQEPSLASAAQGYLAGLGNPIGRVWYWRLGSRF